MQAITHFVQHSNPLILYIIVALILMLESSGVPIANTTVLLFMGAMASMGRLDHIVLACVALSGSVAGACLAYALGERGGRRALLRVMSFFRVGSDKIEIVEHWFNKSGMWMIFFSRMIPYVRPFACFPAGISRMRFWRFFLAALCGSTIWCIALLTIGWNLGRRWKLALSAIQEYTLPTLGILALLIAIYVMVMFALRRYLAWKFRATKARRCETKRSGDLLEAG